MTLFTFLGLLLALAGCTAIHLASPHQRWRPSAWPTRPARTAGLALLLGSALSFGQDLQRLTTVFVWATTLMAALIALPYLGALTSLRRQCRAAP